MRGLSEETVSTISVFLTDDGDEVLAVALVVIATFMPHAPALTYSTRRITLRLRGL